MSKSTCLLIGNTDHRLNCSSSITRQKVVKIILFFLNAPRFWLLIIKIKSFLFSAFHIYMLQSVPLVPLVYFQRLIYWSYQIMFSIHVQPGGVALNKNTILVTCSMQNKEYYKARRCLLYFYFFRYIYMFLKFSSLNLIAEMLVFKSYHCI